MRWIWGGRLVGCWGSGGAEEGNPLFGDPCCPFVADGDPSPSSPFFRGPIRGGFLPFLWDGSSYHHKCRPSPSPSPSFQTSGREGEREEQASVPLPFRSFRLFLSRRRHRRLCRRRRLYLPPSPSFLLAFNSQISIVSLPPPPPPPLSFRRRRQL